MPILTNSGRVVIAESIEARPIHVAWGTGDNVWVETVPPEDTEAEALMNEVGRRTPDDVAFVVPNPAGTIVLPTGTFSISPTPTNHLYVRTRFTFTDAPSSVIRELAVFVGTVPIAGLPVGQRYFLPAEISDPGRLLHIEHFAPIYRSSAIEESFEVIVTF
jgi:hypothetical protein